MNVEDIQALAESAESAADASLQIVQEREESIEVSSQGGFDPSRHADFGDELISRYKMRFIDGAPAIWDDTHYLVGADAIFSKMIEMNRTIKKTQRNEVMEYLLLTAPRVPIADPKYIAFANGVLDLETLDLLACTPELAITNVVPHKWNPDAVCVELDDALDAWTCNHEDRRKLLLEGVGLCLYRGREFQMCIILLGEGSNGKSTFLLLLRSAVGEDNVAALDIQSLGARFQSVALMGKLANIADDIPSEFVKSKSLSTFKRTVTGNPVEAEYKGGATFNFRPYCTMILSANQMPRLEESDDSVLRRFAPVLFEAKFSAEVGNLDINLSRALESEEAYERLIYLGVMALREAISRGSLTETSERTDIIDEIRQDNSSVYEFACDVLGFGTEEAEDIIGVPTKDLFVRYREFCSGYIRHPFSHGMFTKEMCRIYGVKSGRIRMQYADKKRQVRCFVGKR